MANDILASISILPAIYTVLVIGAGYVALWIKDRVVVDTCPFLPNKRKYQFYKMSAYDKAVQSLIVGVVVIAITCGISGTTFDLISDMKLFIESGRMIPFLMFQFSVIFNIAFDWGFLECMTTKEGLKLISNTLKRK